MRENDSEAGKTCVRLTADDVLRTMEGVTGMARREFISRERGKAGMVAIRAMVARALRREGFSLYGIGRVIGRDHSTVVHLLRATETWEQNSTYPKEREQMRRYESELTATRRAQCGWFSPCTGECLRSCRWECGAVKYDRCNG